LLKIGGKSIIEHVIDALSEVTDSIILITNLPKEFQHLRLLTYSDIIPNSGPLGGIYTGLQMSNTHHNLVIACDMPFIQSHTLEFLINQRKNYDMIIPVTPDGYHPLCAVYSKKCEKPIEELTDSGNLKVTNLFDYVKVKKVDFLFSESELNAFFNINTNEDYSMAISLANTSSAVVRCLQITNGS